MSFTIHGRILDLSVAISVAKVGFTAGPVGVTDPYQPELNLASKQAQPFLCLSSLQKYLYQTPWVQAQGLEQPEGNVISSLANDYLNEISARLAMPLKALHVFTRHTLGLSLIKDVLRACLRAAWAVDCDQGAYQFKLNDRAVSAAFTGVQLYLYRNNDSYIKIELLCLCLF